MKPNAKFLNYHEIEKTFMEIADEIADLDDNVGSSSLLNDDLHLDSLDRAECITKLEKETGISITQSDFDKLSGRDVTVADVCRYFHQRITNELGKAEQ